MGMFSNLLGKIFAHAPAAATPTAAPASAPATAPAATNPAAGSPATPAAAPAATPTVSGVPAAAPQSVDVTAILDGLAAKSSEDLDWKKSIVDMLKLLDMDSSLSARKELATDLGYTGDESDSATMNVWLHKEVMKKLAENGGKVPAELLR